MGILPEELQGKLKRRSIAPSTEFYGEDDVQLTQEVEPQIPAVSNTEFFKVVDINRTIAGATTASFPDGTWRVLGVFWAGELSGAGGEAVAISDFRIRKTGVLADFNFRASFPIAVSPSGALNGSHATCFIPMDLIADSEEDELYLNVGTLTAGTLRENTIFVYLKKVVG